MTPEGTDREALRERLASIRFAGVAVSGSNLLVADAILDADDLLVVDLRCPNCADWIDGWPPGWVKVPGEVPVCQVCRNTGRRDVQVVDADLLREVAVVALLRGQWRSEQREQIKGWAR